MNDTSVQRHVLSYIVLRLQDLNIWTTAMQDSILGCAARPSLKQLSHCTTLPALLHADLGASDLLSSTQFTSAGISVSGSWHVSVLKSRGCSEAIILRCPSHRLTSLPYNTGGAGDPLDGMVLTPYTLPGQAYQQYNLGLSCAL